MRGFELKEYNGAEIVRLINSENVVDQDFGNHLARVYGKHSGRAYPGPTSQLLVDLYQAWNDNAANRWKRAEDDGPSPYEPAHRMPLDYKDAMERPFKPQFSVQTLIESLEAREANPEIWADILAHQPELWK